MNRLQSAFAAVLAFVIKPLTDELVKLNTTLKRMAQTNEEVLAELEEANTAIEEIGAGVKTVGEGLVKIGTETDGLLKAVKDLTDLLAAGGTVPTNIAAAITSVKTKAAAAKEALAAVVVATKEVDDKVADAGGSGDGGQQAPA